MKILSSNVSFSLFAMLSISIVLLPLQCCYGEEIRIEMLFYKTLEPENPDNDSNKRELAIQVGSLVVSFFLASVCVCIFYVQIGRYQDAERPLTFHDIEEDTRIEFSTTVEENAD